MTIYHFVTNEYYKLTDMCPSVQWMSQRNSNNSLKNSSDNQNPKFCLFKTFAHVFYKATTDSSWPPADNITTFASIYWSLAETGSTHKPFEKIYVLHDSNLSINAHALFFKCDCSIHNKTSVKKGSQIQLLIVYKSLR